MAWSKQGSVTVKLDMTSFLRKWGAALVKGIQTAILAKRDINGNSVPKNAKSTIAKKGFNHRGIETGWTRMNGFDFRAGDKSLSVFASTATHPKAGISADEIVYYNQPTTAKVPGNPSTNNPGAEWFGVSDKAEKAFVKELREEAIKQISNKMVFHHTLKVTL